ncbi:MAG: alpha/beta hydrolase [Gemmatimonadetes bacterium]|nr:alpha/beta hydrolase [Gemmatimonadota bacterium]
MEPGSGAFNFDRVKVWYHCPQESLADLPVVFALHGASRNASTYRDTWASHADMHGFLLLAPEFSEAHYPDEETFNLGNVFAKDGTRNALVDWSFQVIEGIFDHVKKRVGLRASSYGFYGHSAGSQFVHRFLYFMPQSHAHIFVAANAGWYTMPTFKQTYPYGLTGSGLAVADLKRSLNQRVVVLLGTDDVDVNHPKLRRTPQAMMQGAHRFERGHTFFETAKREAEALNVPFNWQLDTVPNVGHNNAGMAKVGVAYLV